MKIANFQRNKTCSALIWLNPKAIHLILSIANQKISSVAIGLIWDMRHKLPRFIESERRTFDIGRNQLLNKS